MRTKRGCRRSQPRHVLTPVPSPRTLGHRDWQGPPGQPAPAPGGARRLQLLRTVRQLPGVGVALLCVAQHLRCLKPVWPATEREGAVGHGIPGNVHLGAGLKDGPAGAASGLFRPASHPHLFRAFLSLPYRPSLLRLVPGARGPTWPVTTRPSLHHQARRCTRETAMSRTASHTPAQPPPPCHTYTHCHQLLEQQLACIRNEHLHLAGQLGRSDNMYRR